MFGEPWTGDWALILANSAKYEEYNDSISVADYPAYITKMKDCLVSYLSFTNADKSSSLVSMPVNDMIADRSIEMGTVDRSRDETEAQSTTSLESNASNFTLDITALNEKARMDNIFKLIKNVFVNRKFVPTGTFWWQNKSKEEEPDDTFLKLIQTEGRSLNEIVYQGMPIKFIHAWDALNSLPGDYSLTVPGRFTLQYFDKDNEEMVNLELSAGEELGPEFVSVEPGSHYIISVNGFVTTVPPAGWFILKKGGRPYAYFDYSLINPFTDDTTEHPFIYMPVLKITINGSKLITGASVDWYSYKNGSFLQVTGADLITLYNILSQHCTSCGGPPPDYVLSLRAWNSNDPNDRAEFAFSNTTSIIITSDYYFPTQDSDLADPGKKWAGIIDIRYMFAGVGFEFYWNHHFSPPPP